MKSKINPTIFALVAIVCWGSFATLGKLLNHLPPFFVLGVAFLFGALPSLRKAKEIFPDFKTTAWGIIGLFSYHFFLYSSFRHAPAIEANLINYLWPMIMVLMAPMFFKEEKLSWHHFLGAGLSAVGCACLVLGKDLDLSFVNMKGYLLAFGAALTWPIYSLVKKKMKPTSVWAVGGFCFGSSALFFLTHTFFEPRVVLQTHDLILLILIGVGPLGMAFYAWDMAMTLGDARKIGALSYLTPVISTLGLIFFANEELTLTSAIAMVLIIGGASTGIILKKI